MQGEERRRRRRLVSLKFLSQREVCPVLSLWGSDISKTPDGKFADKPKKVRRKREIGNRRKPNRKKQTNKHKNERNLSFKWMSYGWALHVQNTSVVD